MIVEKLETLNEKNWKIVWFWSALALVITIGAGVLFDFPKETIILTIGVVTNTLFYKFFRYRAGGILAMPLLALYCLDSPKVCMVLIAIAIIVFIYIEFIFNSIVMYGRRLYLNACLVSIVLSTITFHSNLIHLTNTIPTYMTVIPGILAYNLHFDGNNNGHKKTLILAVAQFIMLIIIGKAILLWMR